MHGKQCTTRTYTRTYTTLGHTCTSTRSYVHRLSIDAPMTPMLGTIPMTPMLGTILWIRPLISLRSTIGASVASPIMCACESELQIGTWPSCELQIGSPSLNEPSGARLTFYDPGVYFVAELFLQ